MRDALGRAYAMVKIEIHSLMTLGGRAMGYKHFSGSFFRSVLLGLAGYGLGGCTVGTVNLAPGLLSNSNISVNASGFAPVSSSIMATPSSAGATITWVTNQMADSSVEFGTTTNYGTSTPGIATLVRIHSVVLPGDNTRLKSGTTYYYRVHSHNALGIEGVSADFQFVTLGAPPIGPGNGGNGPQISGVSSLTPGASSVVIQWTTDEPSTSVVQYGTSTQYGPPQISLAMVTAHSVYLSNLSPSTVFHYQVASQDTNGNNSVSSDYQFMTADDPSHVPSITNIAVSGISDTSAVITWNTDIAANSSVTYGPANQIPGSLAMMDFNEVTSHSMTLTGLIPGTNYAFQVQSTSANGVMGQSSWANRFQTMGSVVLPLYINNLSVNPAAQEADIFFQTDRPANTLVEYGSSPWLGSGTGLDSNLVTSHSKTLTGLMPSTTCYYRVTSVDANGVVGVQWGQFQTESLDVAFIQNLYLDLVGRAAGSSDISHAFSLNQGYMTSQARQNLAQWLTSTPEYGAYVINGWYQNILGRQAEGTYWTMGLGVHRAHLQHFMVGGDPDTAVPEYLDSFASFDWRAVMRDIIASAEAWLHYGSNCDSAVAAMYSVFLGRGSSSQERAGWVAQCNQDPMVVQMIGGIPTRISGGSTLSSVAVGIASSLEGINYEVTLLYQQLLKRASDPMGAVGWASAFTQGTRYNTIKSEIASSDEYYNRP